MLYSYIENSFVGNLRTGGRGDVNELRFYDHDNGYSFNAAELSLKKDPSERALSPGLRGGGHRRPRLRRGLIHALPHE